MNDYCEWFFRTGVDSMESINEVMKNNQVQAFYADNAYHQRMLDKLDYCLNFLKIESYKNTEKQKILMSEALDQSDPNAIALEAFNSLYIEKKSISYALTMLIPALQQNNPNAILTLAQMISSHSPSQNNILLENALRIISCEYGSQHCGIDARLVKTTCEISGICGGSLEETIIMSIPGELQNEFNLILENLTGVAESKSWKEFVRESFVLENP